MLNFIICSWVYYLDFVEIIKCLIIIFYHVFVRFAGMFWGVRWMVCGSGKLLRVTRELTRKRVNLCKTFCFWEFASSLFIAQFSLLGLRSTTEWQEICAKSFEVCWVIWWFVSVERVNFLLTVEMIKVKWWYITYISRTYVTIFPQCVYS